MEFMEFFTLHEQWSVQAKGLFCWQGRYGTRVLFAQGTVLFAGAWY
jgi:hypothetical protein